MAAEEYSPRCLRLTGLVINMNAAHYTAWLYRFDLIKQLKLLLFDEIMWLNKLSLENIKNYQIWHHRQLLLDHYYPTPIGYMENEEQTISDFAKAERVFMTVMLKLDTKNYHVWSYRQAMVRKLSQFNIAELVDTQNFIEEDIRNNSAWAHRFFLIFSNPAHSNLAVQPSEPDPNVPVDIIDKEINYAQGKILLAPQNQSPWNYIRGVLVKGGRKFSTIGKFAESFVDGLGEVDEKVHSSHALELLSEVYVEKGDFIMAKLCLNHLAEKWDPVREGYWKYRESLL